MCRNTRYSAQGRDQERAFSVVVWVSAAIEPPGTQFFTQNISHLMLLSTLKGNLATTVFNHQIEVAAAAHLRKVALEPNFFGVNTNK